MRIVIISTSDVIGGAARAAYRLHQELTNTGVQSLMAVQKKGSEDPAILGPETVGEKILAKGRPHADAAVLKLYKNRNRTTPWGTGWFPNPLAKRIDKFSPDIVHLHWIGQGFVPIQELSRIRRPIVWTLHDSWAFTGGCYIPYECKNYMDKCGNCPHLASHSSFDLSRITWHRKHKHWEALNLNIVTPSQWLAGCARKSSLLNGKRVEVIPNGVNTERYRPLDKANARDILSLPARKRLVLLGSSGLNGDPNKGFAHLKSSLEKLAADDLAKSTDLVVMGVSKPIQPLDSIFNTHYLGHLHDDVSMALAYAAADVFVMPSIQENLPNSVMESMACGTPCVVFKIGGMPDLIEHEHEGYLAQPFDTTDLARGINWVLEDGQRWQRLSQQARKKVEQKFDIKNIAKRHMSLYEEIFEATRLSKFH